MKIDSKYLKGLTVVESALTGIKEVDGRKIRQFDNKVRAMLEKDVLAIKEYENEIVFISCDGKKYVMTKLSALGREVVNAL